MPKKTNNFVQRPRKGQSEARIAVKEGKQKEVQTAV